MGQRSLVNCFPGVVDLDFLTTIRATVASDIRIWLVAIGNQTSKDSDVSSHQLTYRVRHGTGNVVLVKSEGSHLGISTDRLWNLTSKHVGMQLQKLHFRKGSNIIDTTREAIVVEIQLGQTAQGEETTWEASGQIVVIQIQKDQFGQVFDFRRDAAGQSATLHAPHGQLGQETNLARNGSNKVVLLWALHHTKKRRVRRRKHRYHNSVSHNDRHLPNSISVTQLSLLQEIPDHWHSLNSLRKRFLSTNGFSKPHGSIPKAPHLSHSLPPVEK